jgi:hypothetical protein
VCEPKDLLSMSECSFVVVLKVARRASMRSSLVAHLFFCVSIVEGLSISEDLPTRVTRR